MKRNSTISRGFRTRRVGGSIQRTGLTAAALGAGVAGATAAARRFGTRRMPRGMRKFVVMSARRKFAGRSMKVALAGLGAGLVGRGLERMGNRTIKRGFGARRS